MKFACKNCHKLYDERIETSYCPHDKFPKQCKKHNRFHCGMPECRAELIIIREDKKKEA